MSQKYLQDLEIRWALGRMQLFPKFFALKNVFWIPPNSLNCRISILLTRGNKNEPYFRVDLFRR
jgi:hypothetical protein